MKALTIIPKKVGSNKIRYIEKPKVERGQVLVNVLQAGICRTDIEINEGLYGEAPKNSDYLIMGHESIGIVDTVNEEVTCLQKGDHVVRTVRRPCIDDCLNCLSGDNDMCLTGNYTESGIKSLHGIMTQTYIDTPNYLVKVPEKHKDVGVLLEPLSFVEKTVHQAYKAQERMRWDPKNALVLGSGPIGLLATMILRDKGLTTTTVARTKKGNLKSEIVETLDGEYLSTEEKPLEELAKEKTNYDIIIEATGNSKLVYNAMNLLGTNGVLCLTSITGDEKTIDFPISKLNLEFVLGNKLMIGVVNANKKDFERGVKRFDSFENKWPGLTKNLITKKIPLEKYSEGFSNTYGIKTVLDLTS
jgi:glucose 1-dehydrogenase